ncbi:permease prefix domain 1-containing protein [Mucisphaera calidilacus]|uniref:Uncharacterized protein n=1 Tax=Mucisphaera calidilacus TaxID=2527982 RepID=A0A518BW49_9BACT|nr:permease prefix domain 1-containing protein [Mucisphaera calidilacus]QDU71198.1 hypothetical protein Pan265_10470 [Mucisphaera calidilacus]
MSGFRDLVQRVTQRLGVDRELRMEVASELEDHLEDSEAEFLRAGESPEQARDSAVRAFGDEAEIAEGLWEANRGRMKWRSVMTWTVRMTLMPAAVLLMIIVLGRMSLQTAMDYEAYLRNPDQTPWAMRLMYGLSDSGMSEEAHLIVFGDLDADSEIARERAIWERFPDDPMYYANYVSRALLGNGYRTADEMTLQTEVDGRTMASIMARGREVDPENGMYDYLEAVLLVREAVTIEGDESLAKEMVRSGQRVKMTPSKIIVHDPALMARAEAMIREGTEKPYATLYPMAMEEHRQSLLPEPQTFFGVYLRMTRGIQVLLPALSQQRQLARFLQGRALQHAQAGEAEQALACVPLIERIAQQQAQESRCAIELLVAYSIQETANWSRILVYELAGDDERAISAREILDEHWAFYDGIKAESGHDLSSKISQAGITMASMIPAIPGYETDFGAWRKIEYAVLDQMALGFGLLGVNVLVLCLSCFSLLRLWRAHDREGRPTLLWIGWRRIILVLGLGLVAPLAVMMLWWLSPWSSRTYGLNESLTWVWGDYLLLICAMVMCFGGVMAWCLHERGRELGMVVPQRFAKWSLLPGVVMLGLLLLYRLSMGDWTSSHEPDEAFVMWLGLLLLAGSAVVAWVGGLWWWMNAGLTEVLLGGVLARVLIPPIVCTILMWIGLSFLYPGTLGAPSMSEFVLASLAYSLPGLAIGFLWVVVWLTSPRLDLGLFAGSVLRSLGPVVAACAVVVTLIVGPWLMWREASLAGQIASQGLLFGQEVERSDLWKLKERLIEEDRGDSSTAGRRFQR